MSGCSWADTLAAYNASVAAQRARASGKPAAAEVDEKTKAEEKEQSVRMELRKLYAADDEKERARRAARRAERAARRKAEEAAAASVAAANGGRAAPPAESRGASVRDIPRFYVKRTTSPAPVDPDPAVDGSGDGSDPNGGPAAPRASLPTQVRRESRTRYLESRAEQLLDDRELALLWDSIQAHSVDAPINAPNAPAPPSSSATLSPPPSATATSFSSSSGSATAVSAFEIEKRLSYESFLRVSASLPPAKAARYFTPSMFLEFPQDGQGRISSRALWRLVSRKTQLTRLRISLTCYDDVGYGYLREQDLENYVYDQLGSLPPLASVERDFYPYYVFTAVRKFSFALDPSRRGKIRIKDIVHSPVMLEFDALRYPHGHALGAGGGGLGGAGMGVGGGGGKKGSWFSAAHTQEVYAIYLGLDANQNGMLSREEFKQYQGGNLTNIFIEGLFSEYRMYPSSTSNEDGADGGAQAASSSSEDQPAELEMDYKTFLDFVLAMEYKTSPASIAYFFRILDHKAQGYLDFATITYWFRAVSEKMAALGHEPVAAAVVASEIFDMVCPKVDGRITLADLIASKCGHTVISILIDVNGFWKYDNRENLMHQEQADEE